MPLLIQSGSYLLLQDGSSKLLLQADSGTTSINSSDSHSISEAVTSLTFGQTESYQGQEGVSLTLSSSETNSFTEAVLSILLSYTETISTSETNSFTSEISYNDTSSFVDSITGIVLSNTESYTTSDTASLIALSLADSLLTSEAIVSLLLNSSDSGSNTDDGSVDGQDTLKSSSDLFSLLESVAISVSLLDTFLLAESSSNSLTNTESGSTTDLSSTALTALDSFTTTELVTQLVVLTSELGIITEGVSCQLSGLDSHSCLDQSVLALTSSDSKTVTEFVALNIGSTDIYLITETNSLGCTVTFNDGGLLTDQGTIVFPASRMTATIIGTSQSTTAKLGTTGIITVTATTRTNQNNNVGTL